MASLFSQNIGLNYKGILNLNTLNGNLSGTLQAVTDGDGNPSPLQLSATAAQISGSLTVTGTTTLSSVNAYVGNPKIRLSRVFLTTTNDDNSSEIEIATTNRTWTDRVDWSKLFLGTLTLSGVAAGIPTNSARLHVRGNGTNPILRLDNGAGFQVVSISDNGTIACTTVTTTSQLTASSLQTNSIIPQVNGDVIIANTWAGSTGSQIRTIANRAQVLTITPDTTNTLTTGTSNIVNVLTPFAPTSGTGVINAISVSGTINQTGGANGITRGLFINPTLTAAANFRAISTDFTFAAPASSSHFFRGLDLNYTINNGVSQTGTATGIFLNATETALNGMGHNLLDLGTGGGTYVSQFSVSRTGLSISVGGFQSVSGNNRFANLIINGGTILQTTNGGSSAAIELTSTGTRLLNIPNLQFGGGTSAFPALRKGTGATLEVVKADGLGYAAIYAGDDSRVLGTFRVQDIAGNNAMIMYGEGISGVRTLWVNGSVGVGVLGNNASARLQVDSTTQGFLPPRMTTAQVNAITSPAEGLVVYSTDENQLCLYNGTSWRKLNDSPL